VVKLTVVLTKISIFLVRLTNFLCEYVSNRNNPLGTAMYEAADKELERYEKTLQYP
jgi:hypothetical protein